MTFVWLAYSITWILIFLYLLNLGHRQQKLARELASLRQAMDKEAVPERF